MKKILFVSLMVLLTVSVSLSQFGIKGGINLGTFGGMAITQGSGVQITVKVEDPTGAVTEVTGYRAGR